MLRHHISALMDHCGGEILFPNIIVNSQVPSRETMKAYEAEGAERVEFDRTFLASMGLAIMERHLLAEDDRIRHDADRLAAAVFEMAGLVKIHHA
jgi:2-phospho-L-lactate transferase/gluconeogenesis factor (CofD/UPF0052 family)